MKSLKKRIIAVIGTVLLTTLFLNGSNTEAVIKPPVIFVGNENVTGGKYIIGAKLHKNLQVIIYNWSKIKAHA